MVIFYYERCVGEMEKCNEHAVIQIQVDNIKEDINGIKADIKEIKEDQKHDRQFYMDTIQTLKENLVRITVLTEKQDTRMDTQDKKIDEYHVSIQEEVSGLRQDMKETFNTHTKWYQDFLSGNFGWTMKVLLVVILVLLGTKIAGFDVTGFLK